LTDVSTARRLGPKRANRIRILFNLKKKAEEKNLEIIAPLIKKNVIRRTYTSKDGKNRQKAPKVQRLVTESRIYRKRIYKESKKSGWKRTIEAAKEYQNFLAEHKKKKAAKAQEAAKAEQAKKVSKEAPKKE